MCYCWQVLRFEKSMPGPVSVCLFILSVCPSLQPVDQGYNVSNCLLFTILINGLTLKLLTSPPQLNVSFERSCLGFS